MICMKEECLATTCGDGYVDQTAGEDCEDGNADPTDGCSACRYLCKDNAACDDAAPCNGTETCDTTAHKCKPGTPEADGTACGKDSVCFGGVCSTVGCGNGTTDTGEECDDGNKADGDGCDNTCKFSCQDDASCDDGDACNGKETCAKDPAKQVCTAGAVLACDDQKTCTTDTCDPLLGCVNTPVDQDGDKHSCDGDCNDANPYVFVGAPECADTVDNDCDGDTDEAPLSGGKCWEDLDGDGFALTTAVTKDVCVCPAGYTNVDPTAGNNDDCYDRTNNTYAKQANPDQTGYYDYGWCSGKILVPGGPCNVPLKYDWNCNEVTEKKWPKPYSGVCKKNTIGAGCTLGGWTTTVPECGVEASYTACTYDRGSGLCMASVVQQTARLPVSMVAWAAIDPASRPCDHV
jgi:cysteine-rich repeat protein